MTIVAGGKSAGPLVADPRRETGETPLRADDLHDVALSGIKVVDDAQDYDYERSIGKRTVAVVLVTAVWFRPL